MSKLTAPTREFCLQGQLLDFVVKEGYKIKYLRLIVREREYWLKVPKALRQSLSLEMQPGAWLEVYGTQELKKTGILKLEAREINLLGKSPGNCPSQKANCHKVLICQKSTCWQRGGKAISEALANQLQDLGLSDRVEVKLTGCLKQCKQGPNLVIMPDKARYSQVSPQQIGKLLEKHF